ncbi:hypothetical protein B0T16DRAFT_419814 [Cercophora newfieldiana]|uniref:Uncharacterized protein n=1 Tax=Cercophora newfieldiana TaxID=92897 RepID=A0AA39XX56_9PEZI|nr:hypothetical protein B0T16DRAFT_419814 [Cercophora newfieldiana]
MRSTRGYLLDSSSSGGCRSRGRSTGCGLPRGSSVMCCALSVTGLGLVGRWLRLMRVVLGIEVVLGCIGCLLALLC